MAMRGRCFNGNPNGIANCHKDVTHMSLFLLPVGIWVLGAIVLTTQVSRIDPYRIQPPLPRASHQGVVWWWVVRPKYL